MANADGRRLLLLIAGAKSHGPEGNGCHDYAWDARVAAAMLARSDVADRLAAVAVEGWPDAELLARADAIALLCDGRDGDLYREALHLADDRVADVAALVARGGGVAVIHFGLFAPERRAAEALDWYGGYFRWQDASGARAWTSRITSLEADVVALTHPATRGVPPRFRLREEFYHRLRLADDAGWTPLLRVPALAIDGEPTADVVAWARVRADGGRGWATSLGHDHANWAVPAYRAALLGGLCWVAGVEPPAAGVRAPFLSRDEAALTLAGRDDAALRVLVLTGNAAHRWHNVFETGPAIASALRRDPRIRVDVVEDPEALTRRAHDVVVLNWCNWQDPVGASDAAKRALSAHVEDGGGLVVAHFANGAFHRSLPGAGGSDWPDYRRLVRRVWDHDGGSAHDDFREFVARPRGEHPIVDGLWPFAVADELYVRQRGEAPIEPLVEADSLVTGAREPLAWAYDVGRGRVFQTLLGHSARTYEAFAAREMLRRACAWTARREVRRLSVQDDLAPIAITAGAAR